MADFDQIAEQFAAHRAQRDALTAQAQSWTGQSVGDLGTFDATPPVAGAELPNIYARLIALSVQRLRVLSDQLAQAYETDKLAALVYARKAYDPGTETLETIGEEPTALAVLEGKERDRLANLLRDAVRLQLEARSQEVIRNHGLRIATLAKTLCEAAGLDWADEDTRRLAQRAIVAAESQVRAVLSA